MREPESKLAAALETVAPRWSERRTERLAEAARRRRSRRRRNRLIGAGLGATVLVALLATLALRPPARQVDMAPAPAPSDLLRFADGSTAQPLDAGSRLRAAETSPERIVVTVLRGGGRFVVAPRPARLFRVESGDVAAEALGTRFAVQQTEAARVRVSVEEGRVRVLWSGGQRVLVAGDVALFPPERAPAPAVELPAPAAPRPRGPGWREHAEEGDYDRAWRALSREGMAAVRDDVKELLLAADVARLSHHPGEAVAPLRRLVRGHRRDPRTPLAAFTLGRVLLEDLGRPREAAAAFAEAERLAPAGPFAEDAVAREVEAWSRAGETARARARALDYLARHPEGRRAASVRRFGGLD